MESLATPAEPGAFNDLKPVAGKVPTSGRHVSQRVTGKRSNKKTSSAISQFGKSAHKRAARMLGYALTLGTTKAWLDFSTIIATRLDDREIAGLAFASLTALDPNIRHDTAKAALRAAGAPLPTFLDGMNEARWWASISNPAELRTHALAAFEAMSPGDQAAFFRHISEIEVAA